MKKCLLLLLLYSFPVLAATVPTDTAILQGMDKVTGRVRELYVPVGKSVKFGELFISVDKCLTKTPEETPENAVFLHVIQNEKELFSGWMFSSNPAISAMEDPVYDIWLVSCSFKTHDDLTTLQTLGENTESIDEAEIED